MDEPKDWDIPSGRCVSHNGFSLHASTNCAPINRDKLDQLCRYDVGSTSVARGKRSKATITRRPALTNEQITMAM